MKVYLVWRYEQWEGDFLSGVYLKEEDACELAESMNESENDPDVSFSVEKVEVK